MIGLLQRVTGASVDVAGERIADIGPGLLVLVGVKQGDSPEIAAKLAHKLLGYRVFPDDAGRMNLSVLATQKDIMLVPQFTLVANTRQGMRPGFSHGASPGDAEALFDALCGHVREGCGGKVAMGRFGADMQVSLVNDGPVTFWLEI